VLAAVEQKQRFIDIVGTLFDSIAILAPGCRGDGSQGALRRVGIVL
jgi:hypothetical protein